MISTDYIRPAAFKAKVIDVSCPRFGLYNMRHGLATFLAEGGADVTVIQRMLGWSSAGCFSAISSQEAGAEGAGSVFRQDEEAGTKKSPSKRRGA